MEFRNQTLFFLLYLTNFMLFGLFVNSNSVDAKQTEVPSIAQDDNGPIELTEHTFNDHISYGSHFVEFYTPWCEICKNLAPIWYQLANSFSNKKPVSISKVNCDENAKACDQFDVTGYPTILWIKDGKKEDEYNGERLFEDLKKYVSERLDRW